uniref:Uncharacterized protein n=1 Tax=Xiphophorus couchianus TaxID=32473 RepID=A0A3B5LKC1_9TELE
MHITLFLFLFVKKKKRREREKSHLSFSFHPKLTPYYCVELIYHMRDPIKYIEVCGFNVRGSSAKHCRYIILLDPQSGPRRRRSWLWNQFFVIEEYRGPEPVLIGRVFILLELFDINKH